MIRCSVITPTHNPRPGFLDRVLVALKAQTLPRDRWEYILVDNASENALSSRVDVSWHPQARLVQEPVLGLTPARLCGLAQARGEILVFVDDDCVLDPDYLERALAMMDDYPHVGVWGAYTEGEFQAPIEPWIKPFAIMLCAMQYSPERDVDVQYALSYQSGPWFPAGAGMVVRRNVAEAYAASVNNDPFRRGLDRTGTSLIGSGDADIAATSVDLGLAIGNTRRLHVTHLIPESRTTLPYMLRLLYASNYGTATFAVHRGLKPRKTPPVDTMMRRIRRWGGRFVRRSPEEQCWTAFSKGYQDGICGLPFDETYR